ncbi:HNH endonuclease [bacterium]|nr:HNH endonuclease [bacterium]
MTTLIERFEEKYVPVTESGCWEWLGGFKSHGAYGGMSMFGKMEFAHRVSYWIFKGEIPAGKILRHTCDNPSCVNPDHLIAGTMKENGEDMVSRGRHDNGGGNPGVKNGGVKLREDQVLEIRKRTESTYTLGREYGVSPTTIGNIKNRKNWSHI